MFARWSTTTLLLVIASCFMVASIALYFDEYLSIKRDQIWKVAPSILLFNQASRRQVISFEKDFELNISAASKPEFASVRFRRRLDHLHHVCDAGIRQGIWEQAERVRRQDTWVQNDNFLVVPGTNFMMCVLPKCGSSSWHWLTRDLREPLSAGHEFGWQDRQKNTQIMQDLSPDDGAKLMSNENAFRGISVRHPFSKLVSGWNQKLARELTYASFLLEAYPHMQEYADDTDKLHVLTFENMAEYIAAYGHDVDNLDYHFLPMEYLCQPCLYPYNYVIKIESMGNDQNWLTHELNIERMPWEEKGPGYFNANQTSPVNILRTYFKNVRRETILKLMDIYYYDFVLFGYTFDVDTLTPGGLV